MAMQRNYFTILFFIKKSKLLKNGEAPICMRITVNGQRAEIQIKRSVEVSKWNSQKECTAGKDRKAMELNHYLDTVRTKGVISDFLYFTAKRKVIWTASSKSKSNGRGIMTNNKDWDVQ